MTPRVGNILFSGHQVRAALDGRLSQVRMLAWKFAKAMMIECEHGYDSCPICDAPKETPWLKMHRRFEEAKFRSDVQHYREWLYVREAFGVTDGLAIRPSADEPIHAQWEIRQNWRARVLKWHPSVHMKREYSRLTLEITGTKLERLQDISEEDCIAEGVMAWAERNEAPDPIGCAEPKYAFRDLWRHLYGPGSWDANPEVVALSFKVHRCNVDEVTL